MSTPKGRAILDIWKERWQAAAKKTNRTSATFSGGWETQPLSLYEGLPKHEATAVFLLRTEVLGLNDWLARIGVPGINPQCPCGTGRQTLQHILAFCPSQIQPRANLLLKTGTTELREILKAKKTAKAAAQWLLETNLLEQFRVAKDIEKESTGDWAPFQLTQEALYNPFVA